MQLYGICLTELTINFTDVDIFLRSLIDTKAHGIIFDYIKYMDSLAISSDDKAYYALKVNEWCDKYESEGYFGLDAVLKDIIRINEAIDIICDDPNGYHYIGISVDVPWAFNHTTKKLSKEDFKNIMTKYFSSFTKEELKLGYYHAEDDCDY